MKKTKGWNFNPFRKKHQTLAEKLADRMDEFYDACEDSISQPGDKPISPRASRLAFPWLGPADWIRHAKFYQMEALLKQHGVFAPSALAGDPLVQMASLIAPYVMDEREFRNLLAVVPDERAHELRHQRKSWTEALAAPKPPIQVGEAASQALARLLAGPTVQESYELGRKTLKQNLVHQTQAYHFLAPYAIARIRSLGGLGPADPAAAPPFGKLVGSEAFAAEMVHRALTAGLDITEHMATITAQSEDVAALGFAERLYAVQQSASLHLIGAPFPDPLPMGRPADLNASNENMFDTAMKLARHCQMMSM